MKNIAKAFGICILTLLTSCGSSDDPATTDDGLETPVLPANYFPASVNNYWNYDVSITDNANAVTTAEDSLYVASRSGDTFMLDVNANNIASGSMSTLLANGTLTEQGTALTLNGSLDFPIDLGIAAIPFEGAVLYDSSVADNTTLFSSSDMFTQDLQGFPITIAYSLSSEKIERLASFTVNGESFSDVEVVDLKLELSVSTSVDILGNPTTFSILDPQDVLTTRAYYGPNVGLLKAESEIRFTLNPTTVALLQTFNINLGIPTSGSGTNVEELTSYLVN
ncbi:hypothetical protein H2O64_09465 [Kordia sp. YSTF-M3]|uniref:Lipocalin-like domain-containing protein n=1 Tax=Kordia aestuariivivens TaxID=2759037 RepID=A0ABR7Q8N9_9FLAO|nr:hypothetical protein [Kordia aestuariivivens]MBC8754897.1 hypothetical protein [Kordia aestuariivivens]